MVTTFTTLEAVWFILIAVLWVGYFILEGFDFGVGMLLPLAAKNKAEKRMVIHSIGPIWDGNEVWLLVAGGATFAAFPNWYATLFSGFYLALFLILFGLIIRGISFEYWGKNDSARWRATWEWSLTIGSFLVSLLWGVAFANIIQGVPINAQQEYTGNLFTLLNPYALLGGVTTVLLFAAHGASFLSLRTTGDVEQRARGLAATLAPAAGVAVTAFLLWTLVNQGNDTGIEIPSALVGVAAIVAVIFAAISARGGNPAKAFAGTVVAIAGLFVAAFIDLFPDVMISSTSAAFNMTLHSASSTNYTLSVMTVVAVIFVPIVLAYTAWTYYVFRHRLTAEDLDDMKTPIDLVAEKTGGAGSGETTP